MHHCMIPYKRSRCMRIPIDQKRKHYRTTEYDANHQIHLDPRSSVPQSKCKFILIGSITTTLNKHQIRHQCLHQILIDFSLVLPFGQSGNRTTSLLYCSFCTSTKGTSVFNIFVIMIKIAIIPLACLFQTSTSFVIICYVVCKIFLKCIHNLINNENVENKDWTRYYKGG